MMIYKVRCIKINTYLYKTEPLMNCSLILISKSMKSNLLFIEKDIYEVGIAQSINGIENHLTRWVQAFAGYVDIEDFHLRNPITATLSSNMDFENQLTKDLLFLLTQMQESVMDKVSQTMNVIYEEIEGGILIPRVRNHFIKQLTSLLVGFSDYSEIVDSMSLCSDKSACYEQFLSSHSDESKWLSDWIDEN